MRLSVVALCALLAMGIAATGALALDRPLGPRFGNTKFKTTFAEADADGERDTDTYVSELIAGESLSVAVAAAKGVPVLLTVTGPDGRDRTPELKVKKAGRKVSFKKLPIDESGTWAVTVTPGEDVSGKYKIAFRVKSLKRVKGKKLSGGTNAPPAIHEFEAVNGSRLSMVIKSKSVETLVSIADSAEPNGGAIPGIKQAAELKKTTTFLRDFVLTGGDGLYSVTLGSTAPTAQYALVLDVDPPERPRKKGVLTELEPRFGAIAEPLRTASGFEVRLEGTAFVQTEDVQPLVFVGNSVAGIREMATDGTWIDIVVPSLSAGLHSVSIRNPDGQSHERADHVFVVQPPVLVDVQRPVGQPIRKLSTLGGDEVTLIGAAFGDHVTVDLDGASVTVLAVESATELRVEAPAMPPGDYNFRVTDDFGRSSSLSFDVRYPRRGFAEGDSGRFPAPTAADDWSSLRLAVGDLDGNGTSDALVLVSPLYAAAYGFETHGLRDEHSRVLGLSETASLIDQTGSKMPDAFGEDFPYDTDDWNATALALGDLDGTGGDELVLGGFADSFEDGSVEGTLYGTNYNAAGVRIFSNSAGRFVLRPEIQPAPHDQRDPVFATDENAAQHEVLGVPIVDLSGPQAIAIGDVDDDGDADVVVARDESEKRHAFLDVGDVDFSQTPPYIASADVAAFVEPPYEVYAYASGTAVLENRLSADGGFVYTTATAMPLSVGGGSTGFTGTEAPGHHARDIALVDIDGDEDLDLVLAWDDPTTVSVAGRKEVLDRSFGGDALVYSSDVPRIATRVLLNDGDGRFTDATDDWMPEGAADEWWHAHRVLAVDVVGDAAPDLVLGLDASVDAFRATSLSPLDATFDAGGAPGDIESGGEVDTYHVDVAEAGRLVVRTRLGTLADSVIEVFGPDSGATLAGRDDDALGKASRVDTAVVAGEYIIEVSAFRTDQTGTYELEVGFLPATLPVAAHDRHALRILENRGEDTGFVDVTADVLPALTGDGDEDFRGRALAVADADADGRLDLVVATTDAVRGAADARLSSLRVLLGTDDGTFVQSTEFVAPISIDTGEAHDVRVMPGGVEPQPSLLLISKEAPEVSPDGRFVRLFDWNR